MPNLTVGSLLPEPLVERLGWFLLHSVWQGALAGVIAAVVLAFIPRHRATVRYAFLTLIMTVAAIGPVMMASVQSTGQGAEVAVSNSPNVVLTAKPVGANGSGARTTTPDPVTTNVASVRGRMAELVKPKLTWLVGAWMLGVTVASFRPLLGWRSIWRLQRICTSPGTDELLVALNRMAVRLGVRQSVRVLISTLAQAPLVLGYFRPVILLPASLLTAIPPAQLESILAHELAHIRRHDFVVNLLQVVVETVYFFHPAIWWMSRQIRIEREHCCDDLVVASLGDRVEYSRALLAVAVQVQANSGLALGAADGSLPDRVRRILDAGPTDRSPWSSLFPCTALAVFAMLLGILAWEGHASPDPKVAAKKAPKPLPDWLKPLNNSGLVAGFDPDGNVVSLSTGDVMTDELMVHLKTLPNLRELDLASSKVTEAGLAQLAELGALEKLTLSLYETGLGDAALKNISKLASLRELTVNSCGTTDAGVRLLENLPQLTTLSLHQEGLLTDAAIASVTKLRKLKDLSLSSYVATEKYGWMRFSKEATRQLAALTELEHLHLVSQGVAPELIQFPGLKSLSLGGNDVDDACAARIARCRTLVSLNLVYSRISDAGLKEISTLTELKSLNIDSLVMTDKGIASLKNLTKLEYISLRASQLSDECIKDLATIKSLTRIDLSGTGYPGVLAPDQARSAQLTLSGLRPLKDLPKLETLWLTNFFSPGDFSTLGELKQLRSLSLIMTAITSQELAQLKKALPSTQVTAMSGGGTVSVDP